MRIIPSSYRGLSEKLLQNARNGKAEGYLPSRLLGSASQFL